MMTQLYALMDQLLPFSWLDHDFMKNALIAVLLMAPLFGILGTVIVNNGMAFFSDSLGHGAFTGIAIGSLLGLVQPVWGAVLFSVVFALGITYIKYRGDSNSDTIIGVFSSTAIALGLFIVTIGGGGFNKYASFLIGDVLSVTPEDLLTIGAVLLLVMIVWSILYNHLLMISLNRSLAESRGIHSFAVETVFTCLIAITVTISIQWVGLLIVNAMLVLPAAASRNISTNVRQYHRYSVLFSFVAGILGLVASYYGNSATGATIVLFAAGIYFTTLFLSMISKRNNG